MHINIYKSKYIYLVRIISIFLDTGLSMLKKNSKTNRNTKLNFMIIKTSSILNRNDIQLTYKYILSLSELWLQIILPLSFAKLFIEAKCTIAWQIHPSRLLQHLYFLKKHEKCSQMSCIMLRLNEKDIKIINCMCSNVLPALPIFLNIL